jgi:uncharacterized protein YndB with AHSA1/START domain
MTQPATLETYAVLDEPTTLRIERLLPGPVQRVWDYLTKSELRGQWFASGEMDLSVGGAVELIWRNDELTDPPGRRPEGASGEHRMQSRIVEIDLLRKLTISWGPGSTVSFELEGRGSDVLLTIVHRGVADRAKLLSFAPGWHTHLGLLAARLDGRRPKPFWDEIARLKDEYDRRMPA